MTNILIPGHRIRIWRTESELRETYDNEDLHVRAQSFRHHPIDEVCRVLTSMERVTAVEIVNAAGVGFVAYTEW